MTEDEKRQQKAMLLLEYQEADQNLAHLEAKAAKLSQTLAAVSEWLAKMSKRHEEFSDQASAPKSIRTVNITKDPEVPLAMDFQAIIALRTEIKDSRALLNELYQRKKSLGLQ